MKKITFALSLFAIVLLQGFSKPEEKNISTSEAKEKYKSILKNHAFLLVPEKRENPLKWYDSIPEKRFKEGFNPKILNLSARPGEYFVYQVGCWAITEDIGDINVLFSALRTERGPVVSADKMTCFNKGGINFKGEPFEKVVSIPAGRLQSLWMGLDLKSIEEGIYNGSITITSGKEKQTVPIQLTVSGEPVADYGYAEGKNLTRLNWLNSTAGVDETVSKGYLPIKHEGKKISVIGRSLEIAKSGLPESITSYFSPSNQSLLQTGEPLINNQFNFIIEKNDGQIVTLKPGELKILHDSPAKVIWNVKNTSDEFILDCTGQMEYEGFVSYKLKLTAKAPVGIKDIRMEIPVNKDKAEYMMGLNHEGGYRMQDWKWNWDTLRNQDKLWIGSVNGGLQIKWMDENYVRPLVNAYYKHLKLNMPVSWGNDGTGGVNVTEKEKEVLVSAFSGNRDLKKGDILNYDFELLITPFRLLDSKVKYGDRYYHGGDSIPKAKLLGANIMNIHHGNASIYYPFINYPYRDENIAGLTSLVADAHKENMLIKFYYTTRELSVVIPELWPFYSLQGEIFFPGPGPNERRAYQANLKNEWLKDNLREKYIAAWSTTIRNGIFKDWIDLAVVTTPDSRLNNFYVAGLDWMTKNMNVDGIYVDDCALERYTMRRSRKVIDKNRPNGKIDFHAPNLFIGSAGYTNSVNLYMELLPYIDLLWVGEGRDYARNPDHWLIEVSGIPFGVAGQMLQGGGNPWLGMVYGITNRSGYKGDPPTELWKFWDNHNIFEKEMIGYWEKDNPVKSYNPLIKATIYKGENESFIAIGNFYKFPVWGIDNQPVYFDIDFERLGYDPAQCEISIPEIKGFQDQKDAVDMKHMVIPGGKGFIVLIKKKS